MDEITKIALLQLAYTPNEEIVKVAGILSRIKNWLKGKFSPDFAKSLEELKLKSSQNKNTINQLEESIDILQNSIKEGDLALYEITLEKVKILASQLISQLKDTTHTVKEVKKINPNYYSGEDMKSPEFMNKFRAALPESWNLELGKNIDKPLKSIEYYSNMSPEMIQVSAGTLNVIIDRINEQLSRKNIVFDANSINKEQLEQAIKQSIVNGNLIEANIKEPSKNVKHQQIGSVELYISSDSFVLPGTQYVFQSEFRLLDQSTRKSRIKIFPLRGTTHMTYIGKKSQASMYDFLTKTADQVEIKNTTISGVKFAEIMRQGYKMVFGEDPSAEVLGIGWAQAIAEEGDGIGNTIILPCNNVGNIRATASWIKSGKPYYAAKTKENTPEGKTIEDHGATWRAFATPEEGAASYWQLIKNNYPTSFKWMQAGDATSANATMGLKGYYTASIKEYTSAVQRIYDNFQKNILPKLSGLKSDVKPPPGEKPKIKDWVSQYSTSEKEKALNPTPSSIPANDNGSNEMIDSLFKQLVAGDLVNKFIKKANNKEDSFSNCLIRIDSDNQIINTCFADKIAFILHKYLKSQTQINSQDNKLDLQIKTADVNTLSHYKLINKLAEIINNNSQHKVSFIVAPNLISNLTEMSNEDIEHNLKIGKNYGIDA